MPSDWQGPPTVTRPDRGSCMTTLCRVSTLYHVSSVANRASIELNGLDWRLMKHASGIAGSIRPEIDGVFLCADRWEADWFVRLNNTGGEVDVWAVEGIAADQLLDAGSGFFYFPGTISPAAVERIHL